MNCLLIWPEFPISYWGAQYLVKLLKKGALMPPLGSLTVAGLCPPEWTLRLVDLNIEALSDNDLKWADIVLISGMTIQQNSMSEVLRRCKKVGVRSVVGGPHATSSPEKLDDATHLVLDEGEITLPMFFKDLQAGNTQRIYRADGKRPDITETPVPRFDLLKIDSYVTMCIQFSRGCPFACEFCDITTLFGRVPRTKTPQQIIAEVQAVYDLGFRGEIFLVDDNFIGNQKNVKLMLPELIAWQKAHNYPYWLYTEASINLADDDEMLKLMGEANFHSVFIGLESPSQESLRETRKFQNLQGDMLSKIHKIQQHGIEVMAGFIVGFDSDTEDIFDRQIDFITKAKIPRAMVGPLNVMPNTELWERLEREGRLQDDFDGDNITFCNFATTLPPLTLVRGYRKMMSTLYSPRNFFDRMRALIDSLDCSRNKTLSRLSPYTAIKWLLPCTGALLHVALINRNRYDYLRFMSWVLCKHPDKFLFALTLTLLGYHFIRYTADVVVPRLTLLEAELTLKESQATGAAILKPAISGVK